MSDQIPVILDTDIGTDVDDILALTLLLGCDHLQCLGVTTVYADTLARAEIARRYLEAAHCSEIPVVPGAPRPLSPLTEQSASYAAYWEYHEGRGILSLSTDVSEDEIAADVEPPRRVFRDQAKLDECARADRAAKFIADRVLSAGERPVTIIAIGPLTNVANAIKLLDARDPTGRWLQGLAGVAMMGGYLGTGPFRPFVRRHEHNVSCDVEAARVVFARLGTRLTMVGGHITCFTVAELPILERALRGKGLMAELLLQQCRIYTSKKRRSYTWIHDPLVVALVAAPELFDVAERALYMTVDAEATDRHGAKTFRGELHSDHAHYAADPIHFLPVRVRVVADFKAVAFASFFYLKLHAVASHLSGSTCGPSPSYLG